MKKVTKPSYRLGLVMLMAACWIVNEPKSTFATEEASQCSFSVVDRCGTLSTCTIPPLGLNDDGTPKAYLLEDGCELDFGQRTLIIAPGAVLRGKTAGSSFTIEAERFIHRGTIENNNRGKITIKAKKEMTLEPGSLIQALDAGEITLSLKTIELNKRYENGQVVGIKAGPLFHLQKGATIRASTLGEDPGQIYIEALRSNVLIDGLIENNAGTHVQYTEQEADEDGNPIDYDFADGGWVEISTNKGGHVFIRGDIYANSDGAESIGGAIEIFTRSEGNVEIWSSSLLQAEAPFRFSGNGDVYADGCTVKLDGVMDTQTGKSTDTVTLGDWGFNQINYRTDLKITGKMLTGNPRLPATHDDQGENMINCVGNKKNGSPNNSCVIPWKPKNKGQITPAPYEAFNSLLGTCSPILMDYPEVLQEPWNPDELPALPEENDDDTNSSGGETGGETPFGCQSNTDCNDGNACTVDSCVPDPEQFNTNKCLNTEYGFSLNNYGPISCNLRNIQSEMDKSYLNSETGKKISACATKKCKKRMKASLKKLEKLIFKSLSTVRKKGEYVCRKGSIKKWNKLSTKLESWAESNFASKKQLKRNQRKADKGKKVRVYGLQPESRYSAILAEIRELREKSERFEELKCAPPEAASAAKGNELITTSFKSASVSGSSSSEKAPRRKGERKRPNAQNIQN